MRATGLAIAGSTIPRTGCSLEIGRAMARGVLVIPVLVGGAKLPAASQLPNDLQPLVQRQAAVVTTNGFRAEMAGLCADIEAIVGKVLAPLSAARGSGSGALSWSV